MKRVVFLVLVLLLGLGLTLDRRVAAQGDAKAKQAEKARKEYAALQKALGLTDLRAKATALKQFAQAHPDSQYKKYAQDSAATTLEHLMHQLYQRKDMAALGSVAEELLQMRPGSEKALGGALEASYAVKNYAKAAKYGEAFYAKKPSPAIAAALADCYDKLKDRGKFATYAQKVVVGKSDKEAFSYNVRLFDYYGRRKNIPRAASYAQKMLAVYGGSELPPGYTEEKWKQVKGQLYATIGQNHYKRKRYPQALVAYRNSLRFRPRDDEAYYHMGMSNWQQGENRVAMKNLAIASSLGGGYARRAQTSLEALYKGANNGSLEGLDRIKRAAIAELK